MTEKTISAHTDPNTADLAAEVAKLEQRKVAQIAGMGLKLFVNLPPEARTVLWRISSEENEAAWLEMVQKISLTLLQYQYSQAHQEVLKEMNVEHLEPLESEDEILRTAITLTENE